ncbi:MAG: SDR family oxidoreductase [Deltaproteobacteria bacterium]|nr:SDR family oxidoreductase [Deltaproteobacteria bacterium]MBN2846200.1 SDR family oxidoreductase [Deltaproteobacteria bacterium]
MTREQFDGKNVYITGGSSGIGLAAAKAFSKRGANAIIFARGEMRLNGALKELEHSRIQETQKFSSMAVDVSEIDDVSVIMERAIREFGTPDVLVNSAGMAYPNYFEDISYEKFDEMLTINLYGIRNVVSCLLPPMKEARKGYIVNISSIAGIIGVFGYTAYSASKFAVIGFSESLRGELKPHNIKVSVLCPPDTDTPQLHEENKTKPPETKAIAGNAGIMDPDTVAEALIRGMEKGKFMIIPGLEGKFIYLAKRFVPSLVNYVMDGEVKKLTRSREKE